MSPRLPRIVRSPQGLAYLNIGCGSQFSTEWTNLDLQGRPHVIGHDVRRPLPFADAVFDAAYSSHLLEHLTPEDGRRLVAELHRVLRPDGVARIAVPDLEGICREYLRRLEGALERPRGDALARYRWISLELIDQMVRERPGGRMLETLQRGALDRDYVTARCGDEFAAYLRRPAPAADGGAVRLRDRARAAVRRARAKLRLRSPSPRDTGEAHRWMYDRLSLRLLLEAAGFAEVKPRGHDDSAIPHWERYSLDTSADGSGPRKPDSLFLEAVRPAAER